MDDDTRKRLEDIHRRCPRYLFRAWNNSPVEEGAGRLSGGYIGLNRPEAIIPLAFKNGAGNASVYNLTKEELASMAIAHLTGAFLPETELSSWTASLTFALHGVAWKQLGGKKSEDALDNIHVSIIDTKALAESNQVFYVPNLDFLDPGKFHFPHEYLAHGVISGNAHKALPLRVFHKRLTLATSPAMRQSDRKRAIEMTGETVRKARKIGDQYGGHFALPVALAVVCRKKRDATFWRDGVKERELNLISARILDLAIPREWASDEANQPNAHFVPGYGDVEQFCRLMRALAEQENRNVTQRKLVNVGGVMRLSPRNTKQSEQTEDNEVNEDNDNNDQEKTPPKYVNAAQELADRRVTAKQRCATIPELLARQPKRSEQDQKSMNRVQRVLKKLKIDMKKP